MIKRALHQQIDKRLNDSKIIIVVGPRQVGKTTLFQNEYINKDTLVLNGDDFEIRQLLNQPSITKLGHIVGKYKRLIIDEAQRLSDIGLILKMIHDQFPDIKVLATGSSAFELANQINEPLTGRKWEFTMWPLSTHELIDHHGLIKEQSSLEQRLLYGFYPEIINNPDDAKAILGQLSDSYLYKDILTWADIQKPQKLEALIQALALQIGSEVSYYEIGQLIGLHHDTVEKYINLLEKSFIIFRLTALSRNLRNELKKSRKIYFYDLGIRNAVIKNWSPINLRQDKGAIWENYLIVERLKYKAYHAMHTNDYFWRTHAQQEIDFIEDYNGTLHAYEMKWNERRKTKFSKSFTNAYPDHKLMVVNPSNYLEFISRKL